MGATILYDDKVSQVVAAEDVNDHLWVTTDDLEQATGWHLETVGLCRGDACVQTNDAWRDAAGRVDLSAFADHLGQPAVRDGDTWAFGESAGARKAALDTVMAPDFELPDLDGRMHKLSDYRGKKVFLFSWGSY